MGTARIVFSTLQRFEISPRRAIVVLSFVHDLSRILSRRHVSCFLKREPMRRIHVLCFEKARGRKTGSKTDWFTFPNKCYVKYFTFDNEYKFHLPCYSGKWNLYSLSNTSRAVLISRKVVPPPLPKLPLRQARRSSSSR